MEYTATSAAEDGDDLFTCPLCSKSYQRRDLLTRHRRRCQGPSKPFARRKACDECVQAKAKCCYSQPSCRRCSKRGLPCRYATAPYADGAQHRTTTTPKARDSSQPARGADPSTDMNSWALTNFNMAMSVPGEGPAIVSPLMDSYLLRSVDLDFVAGLGWDSTSDSLAQSVTAVAPHTQILSQGMSRRQANRSISQGSGFSLFPANPVSGHSADDPAAGRSISQASFSLYNGDVDVETAPESDLRHRLASTATSSIAPSPKPTDFVAHGTTTTLRSTDASLQALPDMHVISLTNGRDAHRTSADSSRQSFRTRGILSHLVKYPSLLIDDTFQTLLLHTSLYGYDPPDVTLLPLTTMAISCGNGALYKDSAQFMKRAMDGERQRLIKQYPEYRCMQQWDALHAMALYELIEFRDVLWEDGEDWKLRPRVLGLRSPFILKMAQLYAAAYPELRHPNFPTLGETSDPTALKGVWHLWRTTETARRTLFMLNMVNWFSSHDLMTGKQLPYYESLCDNIVLSLPLPCGHKAWIARNESQWLTAMEEDPARVTSHISAIESRAFYTQPGVVLGDAIAALPGPRNMLPSKTIEEHIQERLGATAGLANSDQFRCLIIVAAHYQFQKNI